MPTIKLVSMIAISRPLLAGVEHSEMYLRKCELEYTYTLDMGKLTEEL